jgi:hypothetical protein
MGAQPPLGSGPALDARLLTPYHPVFGKYEDVRLSHDR